MITTEELNRALNPYGLTIEDLSEKELNELKDTLELRQKGVPFLDGFFSNAEILYRRFKK